MSIRSMSVEGRSANLSNKMHKLVRSEREGRRKGQMKGEGELEQGSGGKEGRESWLSSLTFEGKVSS